MDARTWLSKAGLALEPGAVREAQQDLWRVLEDAKEASLPATPTALNGLYTYRVPRVSPDGSCSLHGELAPAPYDLSSALGGRGLQTSFALLALDGLVEFVHARAASGWTGVYQRRELADGPTLVKLAYRGAPSRAEFPLTDTLARSSNNVAVARTGEARVLQDVRAHVAAGGAYYECDPQVRSEVCLPLLDPTGRVVGIVDAESPSVGHWDGPRLALLVALALECAGHLPP